MFDREKLILLDLNNNALSRCDLDELSTFVNLEWLNIGSNNQQEISRGNFNRFYGSLNDLKNMTKLKFLNIEATDINEGLKYLPKGLEAFYCTSHGTYTKVSVIENILNKYTTTVSSQSQYASNLDSDRNYFDKLRK